MAFVLSGNIITQSGTDTSLAGLSAIAGVTTTTTGNQKSYSVGTLQLIIDGTLTIDPRTEELVSNKGNVGVQVSSTGTLNLGLQVTTNGYTYQTNGVAYRNGASPAAWFGPYLATDGALVVVSGGTLNWYGATICLPLNGFHISSGSVFNAINAVCEGSAIGTGGAPAGRCVISSINTNATINGFTMRGGELLFAVNAPSANISGLTREASALATFPNRVSTMSFTDLAVGAKGNTIDVPIQSEDVTLTNTTVVNSQTGTNLIVVGGENATDNRNKGYVSVRKRAVFSSKTQLGANISDAIVYIKDTNNGVRKNLNGIDDTADKVYIYQTNVSGVTLSFDVVTGIVNVAGTNPRGSSNVAPYTVDLRGRTNTLGVDDFYSYIMQYGYSITLLPVVLKGVNTTTYNATLLADSNVTLSSSAALAKLASSFTVNTSTNTITVTANSTLDDVYDAMKAFKCQAVQANLEYPTIDTQPVNASGNTITTAMNIVVNSGVTFSVGTKFKNITTSGAFTLNGSITSGVSVNGNVIQATPTNLNGVVINGNLTYNTNTPITVTLTDCEISGTVSNSGTGLVTLSLSNTTIGTIGSNVATRPVTSLNLTGLTSGSQIYIADGDGVEVAYVASSSTSYTLDTTGQTGVWSVKVARYGYIAQVGSHLPDIASTTLLITLIPDASITQATKSTVAAYTTLANLDKLYDYAAYYETTNAGIIYPRVIEKAGTAASANSYNVTLNNSGSVWTFDGTTLSIYSTFTLASGTTITGALFTTGTVTLTGAQSNTAITANVLQSTPTNLSGMIITGNLTYNTGSASTVTLTDSTVTGTISNSGAGAVKVLKAGTSDWFTAGTNVSIRANVSITTPGDLALSTYVLKNSITDLGWVVQNTARVLEIAEADTFSIYAIAYGYKAKIVSATASDTSTFQLELLPETFIDTTLNTTTRDFIASKFSTSLDAYSRIALALDYDLRAYLPSEVMNAVQYYITTQGELIAAAVIYGGTIDGVEIIQGGLSIGTPGFYGKVNDSVTTTTDLGILVPIYIDVLPSVYIADPTYTPVKKNTSGIVLQTAPWTKQTADISATDKTDIATATSISTWNYTERTLNKALFE